MKKVLFLFLFLVIFTSCERNQSIVSNVNERDANEIVVFLASKKIAAQKVLKKVEAGAEATGVLFDIYVDKDKSVEAMAILNQNGLPRIKGTNLLELFSGKGLMTTEREEAIRYQAGLEEELKNVIRKIDGVLDADVRISFPTSTEATLAGEMPKMKAAVYIKHQGVFDDPNQHLESKIKRLLSGSVDNLSYDDVSIVGDKSRFTDHFPFEPQLISSKMLEKEYVRIWSIVMTKESAKTFRFIFFFLILLIFLFGGILGWFIYKFYPQMISKQNDQPKS